MGLGLLELLVPDLRHGGGRDGRQTPRKLVAEWDIDQPVAFGGDLVLVEELYPG